MTFKVPSYMIAGRFHGKSTKPGHCLTGVYDAETHILTIESHHTPNAVITVDFKPVRRYRIQKGRDDDININRFVNGTTGRRDPDVSSDDDPDHDTDFVATVHDSHLRVDDKNDRSFWLEVQFEGCDCFEGLVC
jgi:hypothetical protein